MAKIVVTYKDSLKQDWDNFVKEADNGGFLFLRDFMEYTAIDFSTAHCCYMIMNN